MKERTAKTWLSYLRWINPRIGSTPLSEVNNLVLRDLIQQMSEAGFMPKTILEYAFVVKAVVASAIGTDGEPLYPRKWNHEFMDLPEVGEQRTPTFTAAPIEQIISRADSQCAMLYIVLAASGLRFGEALALQVTDFQDGTLSIRHSLWNGRITSPKTRLAVREVDLPAPIAEMLTAFIAVRKNGYIFQSAKGTPLAVGSLLRNSLHPILLSMGWKPKEPRQATNPKNRKLLAGFHAFRRYRVSHLRKQRTPENLLKYWIGHSCTSVTDRYDKLCEDQTFRKSVAEQVGIGFNLASCPQWSPKTLHEAGLQVVVN